MSPDLPPLPPRRQLLVVDGFPVMGYDEDDLLAYAAASRAGAAAPPDRSPGPISFYESDGTERRLIWEYGDHSVGIQDGYTPDDNAWEDHALSAATGSPGSATGNSDQQAILQDALRYRWLRDGEIVAEYPYPVIRMNGGDRFADRTIWAEELDAAVDAAMSASTEQP